MKTKILFILLLLNGLTSFSQKFLIPIGYVYNQEHNFHMGVDVQLTEDTFFALAGISDNVTIIDRKIKSNLELHIGAMPFFCLDEPAFLKLLMV